MSFKDESPKQTNDQSIADKIIEDDDSDKLPADI